MKYVAHALVCVSLVFAAAAARAQTSYPMLMSLHPVAAQTGQSSLHTVYARYDLRGATQVLVEGEGVAGEVVPPEEAGDASKPLESLQIRFTVADDALPGVRDFRIATPRGVSTLGQLVVGCEPVLCEEGDNDTPERAQRVTVPATLCGRIEKAEDVDYFRFQAAAGAQLNFHVRSQRLQDKIHDLQTHSDPILTLRSASGSTLASSDNFFFADSFLSYKFDRAGEYLLEIRDVRYQGNTHWVYSIEINEGPFLTGGHPMHLRPGQETNVEPIGFHLPPDAVATLAAPPDAEPGLAWVRLPLPAGLSNPVLLVVSDLPAELESDAPNGEPELAQPVAVPAGISGRLEKEADIDCYAFDAKAGETFSFEVIARRAGSSLDSHLRILNQQGQQLAVNDDMRLGKRTYADSWIEHWAAPQDGTYVIEIRDVHLRGGDDFPYFIQVTRSSPYFLLAIDTDKTQLTPGTGGVIFVRAERKNGFDGEITLAIDGLPPGVEAECGRILPKSDDGCIILQAAADASHGVAHVVVTGSATHAPEEGEPVELSAVAAPYQEIYRPGGGRGHWTSSSHAVSVSAPSDIRKLTLSTYEVTLKPGESQTISVALERSPEYDKNITLDVVYQHLNSIFGNSLPPGVALDKSASKTLLDGKTNEAQITLKAAADAPPVERQLVPVMAHVSLNFVMKTTCTAPPLFVTVEGSEP